MNNKTLVEDVIHLTYMYTYVVLYPTNYQNILILLLLKGISVDFSTEFSMNQ